MTPVNIKAEPFFELLKLKGQSMWEVFAQMIKEEPQLLLFMNAEDEVLFEYVLPVTIEQLKEDQKKFSEEYAEKVASLN